jgi:hypothetical protein
MDGEWIRMETFIFLAPRPDVFANGIFGVAFDPGTDLLIPTIPIFFTNAVVH